ncbi:ribosome hibernation-promoting factor, HPF/YfiA family, partial [Klebsiella pneumoniae]|uniref:ribosome hibernation-promoting factor, HPF/YfiA family n=1 Tax=Klebsiella pneumoniae TaxID=573 RepID=UPI0040561F03
TVRNAGQPCRPVARLCITLPSDRRVQKKLDHNKVTQIADANLHVNGGEIHASAEGQDMYAAVDGLIDKLARQLTKHKDKLKQH